MSELSKKVKKKILFLLISTIFTNDVDVRGMEQSGLFLHSQVVLVARACLGQKQQNFTKKNQLPPISTFFTYCVPGDVGSMKPGMFCNILVAVGSK